MVQVYTLPEQAMLAECDAIKNDPDATPREAHLASLVRDVISDVARHRVGLHAIVEVAGLDGRAVSDAC